ncbi:hypothetical protein GCM10009810_35740 [Nostocoides vanveenii]|uniref:Uncharacterized protein n=1 Tax=Nostocoides vanveenii TaxID=330835 RepID=A0ABP4XEM3_9MICO
MDVADPDIDDVTRLGAQVDHRRSALIVITKVRLRACVCGAGAGNDDPEQAAGGGSE